MSPEIGRQEFGPQLPTRQEVTRLLSDYGPDAQESKDTISLWLIDKQREADEENKPYSRLWLNVDLISIVGNAGFHKRALEYYYDLADMMNGEPSFQEEILSSDAERLIEVFDQLTKIISMTELLIKPEGPEEK